MNVSRNSLILLVIFAIGIALRVYFGLSRPTGDLQFYIVLEQSQSTLLGFAKEIRFYPLLLFPSESSRIYVLAVVTALLFVMALRQITLRSDEKITYITLLIVLSNWYFAQIDMHLIRQQIAIYFFILMISQRTFGVLMIILGVFSIFYHEIALLLISSWIAAILLVKFRLLFIRKLLFYISVLLIPMLYIQGATNGSIFLGYTILGFYLVKKESMRVSLGDIISISILSSLSLISLDLISSVNFTRIIGVLVSLSLFRLMFDGKFQLSNRNIKLTGFLLTLSLYGVISSV